MKLLSISLLCIVLLLFACDDPTSNSQNATSSQNQSHAATKPITVEGCRVYVQHYEGLVIVEVVFVQSISDTGYAKAAVRSAMDQAIAQMPDREIMAKAFDINDNALEAHVYGGELYYDPDTQTTLTDSEKRDYKVERVDYGDYLVIVKERSTAEGITPVRKWLSLKLVWPDEGPTSNAARRVIERESSRYKSRGVDMNLFVFTGDFDNPASWVQIKGSGKYMFAEYDTETRELTPSWDW